MRYNVADTIRGGDMSIFEEKTYHAKCGGLSNEGLGVARIESDKAKENGMKVFVEDLLPGELAKIHITSREKTFAYGEKAELVQASPNRVTPVCSEFSRCGGCQIQHADYSCQLKMKEDMVRSCLHRIGHISLNDLNQLMEPIIGAQDQYFYRNNVQYPIEYSNTNKSVNIGLYEKKTHKIVEHEKCYLVHPSAEVIRGVAQIYFSDHSRSSLAKHLCQLIVRVGFFSKEMMVILVSTRPIKLDAEDFVRECETALSKAQIGMHISSIWTQEKKSSTRKGSSDCWTNVWGKPYIHEFLEHRVFRISPDAFFQVNSKQTVQLYSKVREYLRYDGALPRLLVDLYCGTGSIGIFCSSVCHHLVGIESVESAVIDARANSTANYLENAEFFCGKAEDYDFGVMMPDAVVIDPPRKGCDEKLLHELLRLAPTRIVYVSCNPSTLARDLHRLFQYQETNNVRYAIRSICPVDMFPQTVHIETVVLLSRDR